MRLLYPLVFVIFVGCTHAKIGHNEVVIADSEAVIFETVLRYAFSDNSSALQDRANFYAIELDGRDAPSNFIARFDDIKKPIYPISKTEFDCLKGVHLRNHSQRGVQFFVNSIEYESSTKIKVFWGYSEGCLSSAFSVMTLEFDGSVWVVLDDEVTVVS